MDGLLGKAQQPAGGPGGPGPATPVTGPAPGGPAPGGPAPTGPAGGMQVDPAQQQQVQQLSQEAIKLLYADEQAYQKMVDVFKSAKGDQAVSQAVSMVVNSVMNKIEGQTGKLDGDVVKAIGLIVIITVMQDMAEGGLIQGTEETFVQAAGKTLKDWIANNPDRANVQEMQQMSAQAQGAGQVQGAM